MEAEIGARANIQQEVDKFVEKQKPEELTQFC